MIRCSSFVMVLGLVAAPAAAFAQGRPCACRQGAQEICNGCDDNCNGVIDEGCIGPLMQPLAIAVPVGAVEVSVAPPPMRAELQRPAPGAGYAWVAGYWSWDGTQHAWIPGQWEAPPQPGQVWEAPRWHQRGQRWAFSRGSWHPNNGLNMGTPMQPVAPVQIALPIVTDVMVAPPQMRFERRPPPPGPGFVWVGGYWSWNGSAHAWTSGQWQAPPQQGQTWVAPQWRHRGRHWMFRQGGWNGGPRD